ncbi:hypothetical protein PARA125_001624 [Parachlamydia sp. AcF125]|nr:hypothetical protein [Parachlamydia sp. AcF125]
MPRKKHNNGGTFRDLTKKMDNKKLIESIQGHPYLWSIPQIALASYIAGPMAGCYFLVGILRN